MPEIDVSVNSRGAITGARQVDGAFRDIRTSAKKNLGDMETYGKRTTGAFDTLKRSIFSVKGVLVGLSAGLVIREMMQLVTVASDLQEVTGKFDVVFKGQEVAAKAWAKTLVESYAMSTREAKQHLSSVQDLLVPMGMAAKQAGLMSLEVVKLSADLASFNNLPTAQVMGDIQSALVGNFETMKKYGVILNETVLKQKALNMGLWDGKGMVDANTKAQVAFQLMLEGSAAAMGDLARTSDSYANQVKQLEANIEDLQAMLGNELLPVASDIVKTMNDWVKANDKLIKQNIHTSIDKIKTSIEGIVTVYSALPDGVVGAAGMGILGRMLTGSVPIAKAVFLFTLINAQLEKVGSNIGSIASTAKSMGDPLQNIWDVISGKKDWDTGDSMLDPAPLKVMVDMTEEYKSRVGLLAAVLHNEAAVAAEKAAKEFEELFTAMTSGASKSEHLKQALESLKQKYLEIELAAVSANEAINPGDDFFGLNDIDLTGLSEVEDLMEKIKDLSSGSDSLFEGSIFGDNMDQDINNFMTSLEKVFDMYGKIGVRIEEIAELRKEADREENFDKWFDLMTELNVKEKRLAEDSTKAQLSGYRELFGTTKSLFAENSKAREAMHTAEMVFAAAEIAIGLKKAIVNAVTAATAQGSIPVAGFAMVAAMAAMMGAILSQIGGSFTGGGGGSATAPSLSSSTVLGAADGTGSESISNAYDLLEEYHAEEYNELKKIYGELQDLNQNITGLVTEIVRAGTGYYAGGSTTVAGPDNKLEGTFGQASLGTMFLPFADSILGSIGDFLVGGDTTSTVTYAGINFDPQTMESILNGADVLAKSFQTISSVTDGGIFSDEWSVQENKTDLDPLVLKKLTQVYKSIGETFVSLSEALGTDVQDVYDYVLKGSSLDLMGMDAEEANKAVQEYFSNLTDTMAQDLYGDIIGIYQQIGEGMYETAVRVVMENEIVLETLKMTGQSFEAVADSAMSAEEQSIAFSQALITAAGDLETLVDITNTYYDAFTSEADKQSDLYANLTTAMGDLGQELPSTRQGFSDLITGLGPITDENRDLYISLLKLAEASDEYYSSVEDATETIIEAQRAISGTEQEGAMSDIADRYGLDQGITNEWMQGMVDAFMGMTSEEIIAALDGTGISAEQFVDDILAMQAALDYTAETIQGLTDLQNELNGVSDEYDQLLTKYGLQDSSTAEIQAMIDPYASMDPEVLYDYLIVLGYTDEQIQELTGDIWGLNDGLQDAADAAADAAQAFEDAAHNVAADELTQSLNEMADTVDHVTSVVDSMNASIDKLDFIASGGSEVGYYQSMYETSLGAGNWKDAADWLDLWYDASMSAADAANQVAEDMTDAASAMEDLTDTIQQTIMDITSSSLNVALPTAQLAEMALDYDTLKSAAMATGATTEDANAFLNYTKTYLQAGQDVYKSSTEYTDLYDQVLADISGLPADFVSTGGSDGTGGGSTVTPYTGPSAADFALLAQQLLDATTGTANDLYLRIDWGAYEGTSAEVISMLASIVDEYGWNSTVTITWVADMAAWASKDAEDALTLLNYLIENDDTYNGRAFITFMANLDTTALGVSTAELLFAALLGEKYTATAYIDFIANLYTDESGTFLTSINDWLEDYGIVDSKVSRALEVQLVYTFAASGDINAAGVADWMFAKGVEAALADDMSIRDAALLQNEQLALMFGEHTAAGIGGFIADWSTLVPPGTTAAGLGGDYIAYYGSIGRPAEWAEGAVINRPTLGWVGEAGYPEAVIPMLDGSSIPVKWVGGNSNDEPITINLQIVNENGVTEERVIKVSRREADQVIRLRNQNGKLDSMETYFR